MRSVAIVALVLGAAGFASPPLPAQWSPEPGATVRDAFGPTIGSGAARCRGACGKDCPDTCRRTQRWECVDATHYRLLEVLDCGTNDGCREHDDCLDECALRFPGAGRLGSEQLGWRPIDRNFVLGECSYACHRDAANNFGVVDTLKWAVGDGPYDGRIVFEYSRDAPEAPERIFSCPPGHWLDCTEGRIACRPIEPEPPTPVGPEVPVVDLRVTADRSCVPTGETALVSLAVRGLADERVRWSVAGPAKLDADGTLRPTGEGTARVTAVSLADPELRDEVEVAVGRCACSFTATVSGDSGRNEASGDWAVFSMRGNATLLGGATSSESLADVKALMQGDTARDLVARKLSEALGQGATEPGGAAQPTSGSSVGISLIEIREAPSGASRGGQRLAKAFKIEALSKVSLVPGFSGDIPVEQLVVHTGEFASQGGAPALFRWSPGSAGRVRLHVSGYDGFWLWGSIDADLESVTGISRLDGSGKLKIQVRADFRTGAFHPLRMENVCAFARSGS